MTVSKFNRSKSCKSKESKSVKTHTHGEKSDAHKLVLKVRDINDGFRLLYLIFLAEKSDSIEDLQAFCKEAFNFFQYDERCAEDKKSFDAYIKDKKSIKEFMESVKKFIVPLVFGLHRN